MRQAILVSIGMAMALASCSTAGDPISKAWVGKSAGKFFANYGPPMGEAGPSAYRWKGGYKTVNGSLKSCAGVVSVDGKYNIRAIKITGDRKGENGGSYCEELLTGETK